MHHLILAGRTNYKARNSISHVCPQIQSNNPISKCKQQQRQSSVIVIGALSFLGSKLVAELRAHGLQIHSFVNIEDTSGEWDARHLIWYRKNQLQQLDVTVDIVDFSNITQMEIRMTGLLATNAVVQVVYVPTMATDKMNRGFNSMRMSNQAEEFVMLLELLNKLQTCVKVLLVSDFTSPFGHHMRSRDKHLSIHSAWVGTFESILSTYHSLYSIPITVIRTHGVYGPWSKLALEIEQEITEGETKQSNITKETIQNKYGSDICWYIKDVTKLIHTALTSSMDCALFDLGRCRMLDSMEKLTWYTSIDYLQTHHTDYTWTKLEILERKLHTKVEGVLRMLTWATAYRTSQSFTQNDINVVFTSYFTSMVDAQRHKYKKPNQFAYLAMWIKSIKKLSLSAVIFHDGLLPDFQHRLLQYHPGLSLVYVHSLFNRSTNDARFYNYLHYLDEHSEIDKVLLTDISDVKFQMDPFELMNTLGDRLYIGTDIDIFPNMQSMPWIHQRLRNCFGNYSIEDGLIRLVMDMETVYNAGIIGGTRTTVLSALVRIISYLEITPPNLNCNMPAVNVAVHNHFFTEVFTGFPLNSRFLRNQVSAKGVYIIHK